MSQTRPVAPQKIIIAWIRSIIDVPISPIIFTIGWLEISPLSEPHPTVAPSTAKIEAMPAPHSAYTEFVMRIPAPASDAAVHIANTTTRQTENSTLEGGGASRFSRSGERCAVSGER